MVFQQRNARAFGIAVCLVLVASLAAGQTETSSKSPDIPNDASALEGLPTVRLDVTSDGAKRQKLDRDQAAKQALEVTIVDGRYYWASRENRPLTVTSSNGFTYLSSAEPGKYVRFRKINDRISYVEHVDTEFGSVTYWGELRIVLRK